MDKIEQIGEVKSLEKSIQLDKKDRKILSLLMLDARLSLAELAKHVELSKSNIARRISKLEKQAFINGYHAFVDVSKIGLKSSLVLIRTQTIFSDKQDYIQKLIKNKNIYGITEHTGKYDLIIGIHYKDESEKEKVLDEILDKDIIKDFEIFNIKTHFPKFDYTHEMITKYSPKKSISSEEIINLYEKDLKILTALSENCRIPTIDLAEKLKLPRETISYHIKKLISEGILAKFQPNINFFMLGNEFYFIMFKLIKPTQKDKLIEYLSESLRANTILESDGSYPVMAFVQFKDHNEFRKFEESLLKKFSKELFDYSFEIAKAQYKLDWFPKNLL